MNSMIDVEKIILKALTEDEHAVRKSDQCIATYRCNTKQRCLMAVVITFQGYVFLGTKVKEDFPRHIWREDFHNYQWIADNPEDFEGLEVLEINSKRDFDNLLPSFEFSECSVWTVNQLTIKSLPLEISGTPEHPTLTLDGATPDLRWLRKHGGNMMVMEVQCPCFGHDTLTALDVAEDLTYRKAAKFPVSLPRQYIQ